MCPLSVRLWVYAVGWLRVQHAASVALYAGDAVIGALFAVHGAPDAGGGGCGAVREHYGMQRVEATLLALDEINASGLLPGLRLGAELRDSCWAPHTALRQAMHLVRDAASSTPCTETSAGWGRGAPLLGVLGPGASSASVQVQNLLQLFSIPQVSYSATSRELSDRSRFSTFYRVVPSDLHQARVLLALLRAHNWTYVHALHTDESYGQSGIAVFRELAAQEGVCIAREEPLRAVPTDREVDGVLRRLAGGSQVAVCWCEGRTARALLAGVARAGANGTRLRLVGSDGWADRRDVVAGLEPAARGSLTVRIRSPYLAGFDSHYKKLSPHNNTRNPWFEEFWEQKFNCSLARTTPVGVRLCTGSESLSTGYTQEPKLGLVVRGVYALAHALRAMRADMCDELRAPLCPAMLPFNVSLYKTYLKKIRFRAPDGGLVAFDENGDPPAELSEYDVMSFVRGRGDTWRYVRVGRWRAGRLRLSSERSVRRRTAASHAACSPPCPPGHYKEAAGEAAARCCWACVPCPALSVPWEEGGRSGCRLCPLGSAPDDTSECAAAPVEWGGAVQWARWLAAGVALAGLCSAGGSATALWRHRTTPVVKAASRELCALLLLSSGACHSAALAALMRPSPGSCALVRLAAPALAGVYAAVLARTVRIARLVAAVERAPAARPSLLSSGAQVWLWCALCAPGAVTALWAAAAWPSAPVLWHPERARSVLECGGAEPSRLLPPLAPALALLLACAALAVRTRHLPHNFNEARFIGAAVYATCLMWIAFFPIFVVTEAKTLILCGCVSVSAGVCVALCVWPRVWVCLCRPQRNTRGHFLTARSIRCHLGRYEPHQTHGCRVLSIGAEVVEREPAVCEQCRTGARETAVCGQCQKGARITELRRGWDGDAEVWEVMIALLPHAHHHTLHPRAV